MELAAIAAATAAGDSGGSSGGCSGGYVADTPTAPSVGGARWLVWEPW
jgi:hypothetical protein